MQRPSTTHTGFALHFRQGFPKHLTAGRFSPLLVTSPPNAAHTKKRPCLPVMLQDRARTEKHPISELSTEDIPEVHYSVIK